MPGTGNPTLTCLVEAYGGFRKFSGNVVKSVPEAVSRNRSQTEDTFFTLIDSRMNCLFGKGCVWVELHPVGFDSHDCVRVGSELNVRQLSEHWVR